MFSGHFKSYIDVAKWPYLNVWAVYLLFLISLHINAIILLIQTDLWMQSMLKHKRWDLSHKSITADHNQSYPIIS